MKPLDTASGRQEGFSADGPPLNRIARRQNEPEFQALQAAWKLLYRSALRTFYLQAVLTVAIPISLGVALLLLPGVTNVSVRVVEILKAVAGFYGLIIVLIDDRVLDQRQQRLKKEAATVQETFDRDLFELSWGRGKPQPLDGGKVRTLARRWQAVDPRPDEMRDWYPAVISNLPLYAARIVAQRSGIWWDADLRARYVMALQVFAAGVLLGTLVICLTLEASLADSLVAGATMTPVLRWAIREERRQKAVKERLEAQANDVRALWKQVVTGQISEADATIEARDLQDAIFERRRSSPLGFSWLYRLLRGRLEEQMADDAGHCVDDFHRHRERAHG
jgi:hypothetical protein